MIIFLKVISLKKKKIFDINSNYKIFFTDIKKLTVQIDKYLVQKKTGIVDFSSNRKISILYLAKKYLKNFKELKINSK